MAGPSTAGRKGHLRPRLLDNLEGPVLASPHVNKRTFRFACFCFVTLCFAHSSFSAPHQGCKPPTPADCHVTPRAGGRVLGKNRLARRAAESLTTTSDRRPDLMKSLYGGSVVTAATLIALSLFTYASPL